jgi:hypothetical protein
MDAVSVMCPPGVAEVSAKRAGMSATALDSVRKRANGLALLSDRRTTMGIRAEDLNLPDALLSAARHAVAQLADTKQRAELRRAALNSRHGCFFLPQWRPFREPLSAFGLRPEDPEHATALALAVGVAEGEQS